MGGGTVFLLMLLAFCIGVGVVLGWLRGRSLRQLGGAPTMKAAINICPMQGPGVSPSSSSSTYQAPAIGGGSAAVCTSESVTTPLALAAQPITPATPLPDATAIPPADPDPSASHV